MNGRIDGIMGHHKSREAEIRYVIEKRACNAYDVSSRIGWNIPGQTWEQFPALQKRFAVTETIAHLELMRWEGKVEKCVREDGILYRPL